MPFKRFLVKLSAYILSILLLSSIVDYFISYYLRHSDLLEFQAWNNIYNKQWDSDLLIMGSSRAFVQYNPHIIDSILNIDSYNLGFNGSAVNRQITRFNTFCRVQGTRPKYVIYNLDFMTIQMTTNFEKEQFYPYFFNDREMIEEASEYQGFSFFEKYCPLFRYCKCLFDYHVYDVALDSINYRPLFKGFVNVGLDWDGSMLNSIDSIPFSYDERASQMFESFLSKADQSGVKVLFVYAPVYKELDRKIVNRDLMFKRFNELADKYHVKVLDYTCDPICEDSAYFYNATHLNRLGADIFSVKLANDIDSLKWIK